MHVLRSHRWLLARLFSWMRFSMKSTASTLRAVTASGPGEPPDASAQLQNALLLDASKHCQAPMDSYRSSQGFG